MSLTTSLLDAQSRLAEIPDEMEAISKVAEDAGREMTDAELQSIEDGQTEFDKLSKTVVNLKKAVEAKETVQKANLTHELIASAQAKQTGQFGGTPTRLPAVASHQKSRYFKNNADAFNAGMWLGAVALKREDCKQYCREHGVGGYRAALEETTDTLGGFTVPTPLSNQIIDLVEQWGVYRMNTRNITMTSETLAVPVLVDEIVKGTKSGAIFYPGEGIAITPADRTFASVLLTAVKYAQLTLLSTELNEDSIISVIDLLVRDFARQFAYSEDLNAFIGDGGADYGGQTGIKAAILAGSTVTAANAAGITLLDFNSMAGKTPAYAGFSGKYYMNKQTWYEIVLPLLQAANGTDMRQIEEGGRPILNGDPVVITQVMEDPAAAAQVAVYGDLDLGSYMGTRRAVSIRTLTELYAASDQLAVIGTLRSNIQIHSVGTSTAAGAITNLITTA